jgi:hypothetical protein
VWHKKQSRDRAKRKFFYSELTGIWKDNGLEQQAYALVKHVNMSLSDVRDLTLLERNAYIKLLKDENSRQKEELERHKSRRN